MHIQHTRGGPDFFVHDLLMSKMIMTMLDSSMLSQFVCVYIYIYIYVCMYVYDHDYV